jgi:hypothetical protein
MYHVWNYHGFGQLDCGLLDNHTCPTSQIW